MFWYNFFSIYIYISRAFLCKINCLYTWLFNNMFMELFKMKPTKTEKIRDISIAILCIALIFGVGVLVVQRVSCEMQFYNGYC